MQADDYLEPSWFDCRTSNERHELKQSGFLYMTAFVSRKKITELYFNFRDTAVSLFSEIP